MGERSVRWLLPALAVLLPACGSATTTSEDDGGTGDAPPADVPGETDVPPEADAPPPDVPPEALEDAGGDEADAAPGRAIGAPCSLAEQCADGLVPAECLTMVWAIEAPNGYCTAIGCHDDADCPGGAEVAACAELYGGVRACFRRCASEADCRIDEGYRCIDPDGDDSAPRVCLPFCRANTDCTEPDMACDTHGRPPLCHDATGRQNGEPCAHHSDCAAGSYCLAERALFGGWPKGYCTQDCLTEEECGNGGTCILSCADDDGRPTTDPCDDDTRPGVPDPDNRGICMATCTPGPEACARQGYTCKSLGPARGAEKNVCAPDCNEAHGGCGETGWICDPYAGVFLGGATFGFGRCQPPLDTVALGGPCRITSGCRGGFCLAESLVGYPHGLCAEECGPLDPCPDDLQCTGGGLFTGFCFRPCDTSADDCRAGTRCESVGASVSACIPDCTTNADCLNQCCHLDGTGLCDPRRILCMM